MEQRRLGPRGPMLSAIGLGCNNFGMKLAEDEAAQVVHTALEVGITHFDTAEQYGGGVSETLLGRALGRDRPTVTIATKFNPRPAGEFRPGDLARRIVEACEGSLRRLSTDHIDLYYQHYPDPEAPAEELFDALTTLVDAGKIRHAAISNADVEHLQPCGIGTSSVTWSGLQTEWSLLERAAEEKLIPAALAAGLGVIPYFPLASGLLTGKYQRGKQYPAGSRLATLAWSENVATEDNFARVERLEEFARGRGHTILDLALGWLLSQVGVSSVIAGATTPAQVRSNAAASIWRLNAEELSGVDAALRSVEGVPR